MDGKVSLGHSTWVGVRTEWAQRKVSQASEREVSILSTTVLTGALIKSIHWLGFWLPHSFICWLLLSFTHSLIHSFIHSFRRLKP